MPKNFYTGDVNHGAIFVEVLNFVENLRAKTSKAQAMTLSRGDAGNRVAFHV